MAVIRKKAKKTTDKVEAKVETAKTGTLLEAVFMRERRLTVSVGTSADYGKAKIGLSLTQNLKKGEDALAVVDSMYDELVEKLEEKFDDLCEKVGADEDSAEEEDDVMGEEDDVMGEEDDVMGEEDDVMEEEDGVMEEDEEITEDEIMKMKKSELVKLIEEEELEIDVKTFKKIGDLRKAVVDNLFEEEDAEGNEDEDGDWDAEDGGEDDEEWGDDD